MKERATTLRLLGLSSLLVVVIVLTACGSTTTNPSASPTPTPNTPTGPPTAQLTTVGTGGLGGGLAVGSVTCSFPTLDGLTIDVFSSPQAAGVSVRITLRAGMVTVLADAGSGAQFTARTFIGSGITGFDATRGAHINSTLTETASGTSPPGSLGTITSISGTIACNNQQPGISTVILTGNTPTGALSGGISPVHVQCEPSGGVLTLGVTNAGATPELVDMFGGTMPNGTPTVSLLLFPKGTGQDQHYTANGAGVATVSSTGVHFNADVIEDGTSGATAVTVHISGDVTCGSSVVP